MKNGGIGFAFDGDGDRLAVLKSEKSGVKVYKGDELAIIFANSLKNLLLSFFYIFNYF